MIYRSMSMSSMSILPISMPSNLTFGPSVGVGMMMFMWQQEWQDCRTHGKDHDVRWPAVPVLFGNWCDSSPFHVNVDVNHLSDDTRRSDLSR
mmetsp:Transcript_16795/g.25260  ORF Transcript_16795/g.25260 Transcript_16795/m.25260 type:complete len:92 (-) Transcript_16795:53-328(-)